MLAGLALYARQSLLVAYIVLGAMLATPASVLGGAHIVRVHDVKATVRLVRAFESMTDR